MALVAHRMMLPARHRRTQQQVARNKVGVLLVPSLADYYNKDGDQLQQQPQQQLQLQLQQQVTPATSQLELQAGEGKLAHIWYCLEPAAYEEVRSNYSPRNSSMEQDRIKEEMVVTEIITQAAVDHEKQKKQWFYEAKEKHS
ncbi:hypothetical protein KR215_009625, partial [Drosophila sulfurigaster]